VLGHDPLGLRAVALELGDKELRLLVEQGGGQAAEVEDA